MVEGGRIGHAHSNNQAGKALDETLVLDSALHQTVKLLREQGELEVYADFLKPAACSAFDITSP